MKRGDLLSYFNNQNEAFADLLRGFVSHQTNTHQTENINRFLNNIQGLFEEFNPAISRVATDMGDILSMLFFEKNRDEVVWLAHVDTVRVTERPPPVIIEDDCLFGSGSYDMKNAIALFYFCIKAFHEYPFPCPKRIRIILTPDEEAGSHASLPFLLKTCKHVRAVIVPEISCPDGGVKLRRKGVATLRAELAGRASHSGIEPEIGIDANRGLLRLIEKIEEIVRRYPDVFFNPGIVKGGVATNIVSPECTLEGELRCFSNQTLQNVLAELNTITAVDRVKVHMSAAILHPALEFNEQNERLYEKAKRIANGLGHDLPNCSSGGASDASDLSAAGIPVIDGLGMRGGGAHSAQEFVRLSDFPFRATLITRLTQEI